MCLDGDDQKLFRVAVMDLGIMLSAFLRLAIELYHHLLAMEKHSRPCVSDAHLTENAIRLIKTITIFTS
jgi:hypothetical protein